MTEPLDRGEVIRLLNQLGSDQDADVLKAARDLYAQITAADVGWDTLLMPDEPVAAADTDETAAADDADDADSLITDAAPSTGKIGSDADTLALIEKLLAAPDRSEVLREELEEYKADIANGDFVAKDHKYVRALYERLTQ
ncbi:MAG: hypothetical protein ACI8S3_001478 [Alphaproteobacteria bacterium]|jgi:hypothetical protein